MSQKRGGPPDRPMPQTQDTPEVEHTLDDTPEYDASVDDTVVAISRVPASVHFQRLESLMVEALDEGDDFSRDQARAILNRMGNLLGPDFEL